MDIYCPKCGAGREVDFTEQDTFTWQCRKCMRKHRHEGIEKKTSFNLDAFLTPLTKEDKEDTEASNEIDINMFISEEEEDGKASRAKPKTRKS